MTVDAAPSPDDSGGEGQPSTAGEQTATLESGLDSGDGIAV